MFDQEAKVTGFETESERDGADRRPAQLTRGEGREAVICTATEAGKKSLYRLT
jgi:hypothetical protein